METFHYLGYLFLIILVCTVILCYFFILVNNFVIYCRNNYNAVSMNIDINKLSLYMGIDIQYVSKVIYVCLILDSVSHCGFGKVWTKCWLSAIFYLHLLRSVNTSVLAEYRFKWAFEAVVGILCLVLVYIITTTSASLSYCEKEEMKNAHFFKMFCMQCLRFF